MSPHFARARLVLIASACFVAPFAAPVRAQCATNWSAGLGSPGYANTRAITSFDPGTGERVYFAAGTTVFSWDGTDIDFVYSSPGGFPSVDTLSSGDLGSGARIFLTETDGQHLPPRIIRMFDGATWTRIGGATGTINATQVVDDGTGPALFVTGTMTNIDGIPVGQIARWTGTTWVDFSAGLPPTFNGGPLVMFDDGTGPALYACNTFSALNTASLWKWTGTTWTSVLPQLKAGAHAACVADFGSGPRLVLGGHMRLNDATWAALAEWDGTTLTQLLTSFVETVRFVRPFGSSVYFGFEAAPFFFRYDGTAISAISGLNSVPMRATTLHAPGGDRLFVQGTTITHVRGLDAAGIVGFDGTDFVRIGGGFAGEGRSLTTLDRGAGPELFAAGKIFRAGTSVPITDLDVAHWSGAEWSKIPTVTPLAMEVAVVHGTTLASGGAQLFAGSIFSPQHGVQRWDGVTWSSLDATFQGVVRAFTTYDAGAGAQLVVGGDFVNAAGNRVAIWNGTNLVPLGTGTDGSVRALAAGDLGAGEMLFAAGTFTTAGGSPASNVASWDGSAWSPLAHGIGGTVNALCVFDDGSGPALYAGGAFATADLGPVANIARWNGIAWVPLSTGTDGPVNALVVHDDGRGRALYLGGTFNVSGGVVTPNIARWQAGGFESVSTGTNDSVSALASADDDGDGDDELFAAGTFTDAGGFASQGIARFGGCHHDVSFCAGDGAQLDHTTACPCGNDGAPGRGCASASNPSGAQLTSSGTTQPDTLVLAGNGTGATAFGIYLQHDASGDAPFHDGVICASGNLVRLRGRSSAGGASQFPDPFFAQDATTSLSQRGGVVPGSGAVRYYSLFYRAPAATFCPPATANVTNGVRVTW